MTERVTWETCPVCGLSAAFGWRDGALVQVDCPGGCMLTAADLTGRGPRRHTFQFPRPVPPREPGDGTRCPGRHGRVPR